VNASYIHRKCRIYQIESTEKHENPWWFPCFLLPLQTGNKNMPMTTEAMTQTIAEYFKTQPVLKAWLFGSFARGEETPDSDVDILVEFDHHTPIGLFGYARMHRELQDSLGRRVDLVEEGTLLPFAVHSANRDKRLVYERKN